MGFMSGKAAKPAGMPNLKTAATPSIARNGNMQGAMQATKGQRSYLSGAAGKSLLGG